MISGAAGAILGLLALHAWTGNDEPLERAVACGRHLLARRVETSTGARAWSIRGRTPLTGFSHGAAGIGYALVRLHGATGEADFLSAAREGFAYEAKLFDEEQGNWPDLRTITSGSAGTRFAASWCHGAPGIGLSRLEIVNEPAAYADVEAAVRMTLAAGIKGPDGLCCGTLGRLELLLSAGLRLGRPDLAAAARRLASAVLARRQRTGALRLRPGHTVEADSPGLFSGTAGIGYQLLRLNSPEHVPSVLLWHSGGGDVGKVHA